MLLLPVHHAWGVGSFISKHAVGESWGVSTLTVAIIYNLRVRPFPLLPSPSPPLACSLPTPLFTWPVGLSSPYSSFHLACSPLPTPLFTWPVLLSLLLFSPGLFSSPYSSFHLACSPLPTPLFTWPLPYSSFHLACSPLPTPLFTWPVLLSLLLFSPGLFSSPYSSFHLACSPLPTPLFTWPVLLSLPLSSPGLFSSPSPLLP